MSLKEDFQHIAETLEEDRDDLAEQLSELDDAQRADHKLVVAHYQSLSKKLDDLGTTLNARLDKLFQALAIDEDTVE